ncbi:MAG: malate synthase A [Chloroflexi bacterium]|nr:malate synthase A [Chloroflexota bacterium]
MKSTIQVLGKVSPEAVSILTPEALAFVADLAREFEPTRRSLLQARKARQIEIDAGSLPDFHPGSAGIGAKEWRVAKAPKDLTNRRVEITGPSADPRMFINALNSGAQVYMTDFEDAHAPHWGRTLQGQINLRNAARRTLQVSTPEGRDYRLNAQTSTLVIRPRGWHLAERHLLVDGQPCSGSLFDFGMALFHNAHAQLDNGTGPYFYLPKLQSHLEARLWNQVFDFSEDALKLPRGTINSTVLIEHILAAFEMEEILYELRTHISGLNLGRWDYIYSFIKTFSGDKSMVFPDRSQVTMATHFLRSAAELLVQTCHKRGAYALGGMSTYIPRRDDRAANERALGQVRTDKEREASQGFDGAWVAHPGLVEPVHEVFQRAFTGPHQLHKIPEVKVNASDLLTVPTGEVTEGGLRNNISATLQYVDAWIQGSGAVAIFGLMEDTATAEIARAQLWQWLHANTKVADGRTLTASLYTELRTEELGKLLDTRPHDNPGSLDKAAELLDDLVLSPTFVEFLTVPGMRYLE